MLGIFGKKDKVGGYIAAHGLTKWWLATFTPAERAAMTAKYEPFGYPRRNTLTEGEVAKNGSTRSFLGNLAGWFNTREQRPIAKRILLKAIDTDDGETLDDYFLYMQVIDVFYPDRETDPDALDRAIWGCERQISIQNKAAKAFRKEYPKSPLPSHTGYEQLAVLREKQGRLDDAIKLSKDAKKAGWSGDWDARVARLEKKRAKTA